MLFFLLIAIAASLIGCENSSSDISPDSSQMLGSVSTLPRPYSSLRKDGSLQFRYYSVRSHDFLFDKVFDQATTFHCGMAVVAGEDGIGAIDKNGQYVIEPSSQFAQIRDFVDGIAVAEDAKTNKFGMIDMRGQWVIAPHYRQIFLTFPIPGKVSIDLIPVQEKLGHCGYVDRTGEWVIKPRFKAVNPFSDGLAFAKIGKTKAKERWIVINKNGQKVVAQKYMKGGLFTQNRAWVVLGGDSKWTLIDRRGEVLSRPVFENPSYFVNGVCTAILNGAVVVVDVNAKIVGGVKGSESKRFSEGLAAYKDDEKSKWGFLDAKGNVAIPPKYDTAWTFRGGCSMVTLDGATEYIDRSGNVAARPTSMLNGKGRKKSEKKL